MDDADKLFNELAKPSFETVMNALRPNKGYLLLNPHSFSMHVSEKYHSIVTGCGWTVEEFEKELNNI